MLSQCRGWLRSFRVFNLGAEKRVFAGGFAEIFVLIVVFLW
jgi:hypothetical protein